MSFQSYIIIELLLWIIQFFLICDMIYKTCDTKGVLRGRKRRITVNVLFSLAEIPFVIQGIFSFTSAERYFLKISVLFVGMALILKSSYLIIASMATLLIMMRTCLVPISLYIVMKVFRLSEVPFSGTKYLEAEIIGTIIMAATLIFILAVSKKVLVELPVRDQIIMFANSFIFSLILTFTSISREISIQYYKLYIVIFLMICFYIIFINTAIFHHSEQLENQLKLKYLEYEKQFEKELFSSYDDLRKLRHDFKNHVFYMNSLLESQHYQELSAYFATLSETIYRSTSVVNTGNRLCDLVLNQKRLIAAQHGITLLLNCQIPPVLDIRDMDLVSFLSNILDNAIEASLYVENPEITIDIYRKNQDIFFKVSNQYDSRHSSYSGPNSTTKSDTANHGLGMTILNQITDKYNGSICFNQTDNRFTVLGYLNI